MSLPRAREKHLRRRGVAASVRVPATLVRQDLMVRWPWSQPVERPLPAAELDAIVQDTFGRLLVDRRFERINRRSWVRSEKPSIREEVGVGPLKGYSFMPGWSISLDFVPHVSKSGEIAWHRTAKQYRADLEIEPADDPKRLRADRLAVRGMAGADVVRRACERSAALTIELAEDWFARISDVASLVPLFEEAEHRPVVRFGFDNYVQHRLAYAFVLARAGELVRARAELDRWCERHVFGQFGPPVGVLT